MEDIQHEPEIVDLWVVQPTLARVPGSRSAITYAFASPSATIRPFPRVKADRSAGRVGRALDLFRRAVAVLPDSTHQNAMQVMRFAEQYIASLEPVTHSGDPELLQRPGPRRRYGVGGLCRIKVIFPLCRRSLHVVAGGT